MQITGDTKIADIFDKYGDISEEMMALGMKGVDGNRLHRCCAGMRVDEVNAPESCGESDFFNAEGPTNWRLSRCAEALRQKNFSTRCPDAEDACKIGEFIFKPVPPQEL